MSCYYIILTFAYASKLQDKWQSVPTSLCIPSTKNSYLIEQKKENAHILSKQLGWNET